MAWSSRSRPARGLRAEGVKHNWQFLGRRSQPDTALGVEVWECFICGSKRESWQSTRGAMSRRSRYVAGGATEWQSKCPPCERVTAGQVQP